MPTGYTAGVADETITTFPDFAMQCSRAFGALIMMRDEPSSAPIPERFEPSTGYHLKALAAAKAELERLNSLSDDEATVQAEAEFERRRTERRERNESRLAQKDRYEQMLDSARAWTPPTPDHQGLKDFMIEQLVESIRFDCSPPDPKWDAPPKRLSGAAWLAAKKSEAAETIARHEKYIAEEIERTEGRNCWLAALRQSLATPTQEP